MKWHEREEECRLSLHQKEKAEGEVSRLRSELSLKEQRIMEKNMELQSLQKRVIEIETDSAEKIEQVKKSA